MTRAAEIITRSIGKHQAIYPFTNFYEYIRVYPALISEEAVNFCGSSLSGQTPFVAVG